MGFAVVLDTCVLYPAHLRDTLLRLAELGLYQPLWSDRILRELTNALTTRAAIKPKAVEHMVEQRQSAFSEAAISGYEHLIDSMRCPDPDDRHVLAAAVRSRAGAIVTFNLSDFPAAAVEHYEIEVIDPDDFLLDLLDLAPHPTLGNLKRQAQANRRDPNTLEELLGALHKVRITKFVEEVRLAQEVETILSEVPPVKE